MHVVYPLVRLNSGGKIDRQLSQLQILVRLEVAYIILHAGAYFIYVLYVCCHFHADFAASLLFIH